MCQGAYQVKPPLPFTPGVELCGEVVALGPGVTGFTGGERVVGAAAMPAGSFAEVAIKPLVSERLGLADVIDGLERLAAGTTIGRLTFLP